MTEDEINTTIGHLAGGAADYCNDWAATGPLIEKHHISLVENRANRCWLASPFPLEMAILSPATRSAARKPLVAACLAILMAREDTK